MYLTFTLQLLICITDLTFAGLCLGGVNAVMRTEALKRDVTPSDGAEALKRETTPFERAEALKRDAASPKRADTYDRTQMPILSRAEAMSAVSAESSDSHDRNEDRSDGRFTPVSILKVCAAVFFINAIGVWL